MAKIVHVGSKRYVELEVACVHQTTKAILVANLKDNNVWIPHSQLEDFEELDKGMVNIIMPEWLAIEKELV